MTPGDRFGRSAAEAEAYLHCFKTSYFLQRLDVEGDDVRLLRAYPSRWQVRSATSINTFLDLLESLF